MEETLEQIGLTAEETDIYLSLLNTGTQSAAQLGKNTKVKRTYVYRIVQNLINKGLATQGKQGRTTVFSPNSPDHLLTLASKKKQQAEQAEKQVESYIASLKRLYSAIEEKPLVTQYEGILGLKKVYKDINDEGQDIMLFRSYYDDKNTEIDELINKQIEEQVKRNIHAKVIGPVEEGHKELITDLDEKRLVEERLMPTTFRIPSQIIIYSTKVAIISLKKSIITTLIDNKDISDSFRELFNYIWETSTPHHKEIVNELVKK